MILIGPDLLTGAPRGAGDSLVATVLFTAAGVAMMVVAHRRGLIVPPRWRRHRS